MAVAWVNEVRLQHEETWDDINQTLVSTGNLRISADYYIWEDEDQRGVGQAILTIPGLAVPTDVIDDLRGVIVTQADDDGYTLATTDIWLQEHVH